MPACITEHTDGKVTFKIVAGPDRRKSATVAREEFASWAKYEVVLKENEWIKLTRDRYREPEELIYSRDIKRGDLSCSVAASTIG